MKLDPGDREAGNRKSEVGGRKDIVRAPGIRSKSMITSDERRATSDGQTELPLAILFDLDDTIIAYDSVVEEMCRAVCEEYAAGKSDVDPQEMTRVVREVSNWYWNDPERHRRGRANIAAARQYIYRQAFDRLSLPEADAIATADEYSRRRLEDLEPFPQAIETLDKLRDLGIRLALLSNGEAYVQRYKLDKFELAEYFEYIGIEGEQDFGKPDPRVFTTALEVMELDTEDAWMVGDSLSFDIIPAKQLGIYTVWNDWRGKGLPPESKVEPDRIINSISELIS